MIIIKWSFQFLIDIWWIEYSARWYINRFMRCNTFMAFRGGFTTFAGNFIVFHYIFFLLQVNNIFYITIIYYCILDKTRFGKTDRWNQCRTATMSCWSEHFGHSTKSEYWWPSESAVCVLKLWSCAGWITWEYMLIDGSTTLLMLCVFVLS